MTDRILKDRLGFLLIIAHFLDVFLLFLFKTMGWFDDAGVKIGISVLTPLFGTYTTKVVTDLIAHRYRISRGKVINRSAVWAITLIAVLCVSVITGIIIFQAIWPAGVETFSLWLGGAEGFFAVYMGLIFKGIFGKK